MNTRTLPEPCRECGNSVELHWQKDVEDILTLHNLCFTCNFWREKEEIKDEPRIARIDGVHFSVGEECPDAPAFCKGHGGSKFAIKFFDGRHVESRNLWCQGSIPHTWRERLPNNAEFVYDAKNPPTENTP